MKTIIYNMDNLSDSDITELSIRTKVLLINNDNILLGNENNVLQFPGGHLEENESLEECLTREIKEETGIDIDINNISKPFMEIDYFNKDWPEVGKNRKSEIYYYIVKTDKEVDINNLNLTEHEKENNFKIDIVPIKDAIKYIEDNIKNNTMNEVIAPDMIIALNEYLS